jgi:hypothetical protein
MREQYVHRPVEPRRCHMAQWRRRYYTKRFVDEAR